MLNTRRNGRYSEIFKKAVGPVVHYQLVRKVRLGHERQQRVLQIWLFGILSLIGLGLGSGQVEIGLGTVFLSGLDWAFDYGALSQ